MITTNPNAGSQSHFILELIIFQGFCALFHETKSKIKCIILADQMSNLKAQTTDFMKLSYMNMTSFEPIDKLKKKCHDSHGEEQMLK
jgi:hypothetical protein